MAGCAAIGASADQAIEIPRAGGEISAEFDSESPLSIGVKGSYGSNPGRVIADPSSADTYYKEGASVLLWAIPEPGWEFVRWFGDVGGRDSPTSVTVDAPMYAEAVFSRSPELRCGEDQAVHFPATDFRFKPVDREYGFRVHPPSDATEIRIELSGLTPAAEVELFVTADSDRLHWRYSADGATPEFNVDFRSGSAGTTGSVVISRDSVPPLDLESEYYIAFAVFTPRTEIDGTLRAEVVRDEQAWTPARMRPRALTFAASEGEVPAKQVIRLENPGESPLQFRVAPGALWLDANPREGSIAAGESAEVEIGVTGVSLPPESYRATVAVETGPVTQGSSRSLAAVPVALVVVPDEAGMP